MKTNLKGQSGFTLIELILVIAILGILAVAVAPSFTNLLTSASTTGGRGTAGAIQSGINTVYAQRVAANITPFWVATLDGSANGLCTNANPCFGTVVQPVTSNAWTKFNATNYDYNAGGITQNYSYNPGNGTFQCIGGTC